MFGIGGSEILVILIVALLFLGPDKMPDAARQISKGIRDLKRGSREIQRTIENDATIGGAIRDLKSALNGEDPPPKKVKPKAKPVVAAVAAVTPDAALPAAAAAVAPALAPAEEAEVFDHRQLERLAAPAPAAHVPAPVAVKLLADDAGELDPDHAEGQHDREELAAMIRPASGIVAKGSSTVEPEATAAAPTEPKHG